MLKTVQVWVGPEPAEEIIDCMKWNKSLSSGYVLISESNFLQAPEWIDLYKYCMDEMSLFSPAFDTITKKVLLSDFIRFYYFSKNNGFYLDCDAKIKFFPPFYKGAHFVKSFSSVDYFCFYNYGDTEFFPKFFNTLMELYKTGFIKDSTQVKIMLEKWRGKYNGFCPVYIEHKNKESWVNGDNICKY